MANAGVNPVVPSRWSKSWAARRCDQRLGTRIAWTASGLTLAFVLAVGSTSYYVARLQIVQSIRTAVENEAGLHADHLSNRLSAVVTTLGPLTDNALILNSLMDSLTRDTSLIPFLKDFSTVSGIPVAIALTEFDGNPIAGDQRLALSHHDWKAPVLEQGKPFVTIRPSPVGDVLFIAEPIHFMRTLSPEGALIYQVAFQDVVGSYANSERKLNRLRLLRGGGEALALAQGDAAARAIAPEGALKHNQALDLPELLAPLDLTIEVSADRKALSEPLERLFQAYALLATLLVAIVLGLSILASRYLSRPLREFAQVASSIIDSGSFSHRFSVHGMAETARLGSAFNRMLERLGSAYRELERKAEEEISRNQALADINRALQEEVAERKKAEKRLASLASHDPLTGLANRSMFRTRLESDILHTKRSGESLGILLIDLDNFKDVNDTLGHPVGDSLLVEVATRLQAVVRDTDTVARLGGDEFAMVTTHLQNPDDAATIAQKIVSYLDEPFRLEGHDIYITASTGIALYPGDGRDPDQLLRHADLALYAVKAEGRNGFSFFDGKMNAKAQAHKAMEEAVRAALCEEAFCLHFQPNVDLALKRVTGVEALVRWRHPQRGLVLPEEFIPVAEATGLIAPLGEWVLRKACEQQVHWTRSGLPAIPMAVNVSAVQLKHSNFVKMLTTVLDETGMVASSLELEITEGVIMDKTALTTRALQNFRELGVRLAIDDFGTGYSSLAYLKQFPFDTLKIDRSFVRDIDADPKNAAISQAIIQLGTSLKLNIVAEGVETEAQATVLGHYGCQRAQGYHFSRPLSAAAFEAYWRKGHGAEALHAQAMAPLSSTGYPPL